MPDVDGIELLRHIRSDEAFNSMPVVSESLFKQEDRLHRHGGECLEKQYQPVRL